MLNEKLAERRLPDLMTMNDGRAVTTPDLWRERREELIDLLRREEYGYTPAAPEQVTGTVEKETLVCAGKATQYDVMLSFDTPRGAFSFPIALIVPKTPEKPPVFVHISFFTPIPSKYLPIEEVVDRGYAVAAFNYESVTSDKADIDGLAAMYPIDEKTGWGTIGMWAFAASRVLDYLETRSDVDAARACVTGHSRLGKTALWCAAQDERFTMAVSNDSGCSGAAISRGKVGESIERITRVFPYWFCGNYRAWADREYEAPFDQHMLLSLIAPRKLYVCSAIEDTWADPESEFLACIAASPAWSVQRVPGLISPDDMPSVDQPLMEGNVCYHVRTGTHFHSRTDWNWHMDCRDRYHI